MNDRSKTKKIALISVLLLVVFLCSALLIGAFNMDSKPVGIMTPNVVRQLAKKGESLIMGDLDESILKYEPQKPFDQELLDELIKYKTPHAGDNSKVGHIVSRLPPPDSNMKYDHFDLQTEQEPYGLTIYYVPVNKIEKYPLDEYGNPYSSYNKTRDKDLVLLFSLIDNLGYVSLNTDFTSVDNGHGVVTLNRSSYTVNGSSDELWADNAKKIFEVFRDIDSLILETSPEPKDETNLRIDELLDSIMSSPKEVSNPYAYISDHREQYDEILAMGDAALPYIVEIWNADQGLKGAIAFYLCQDMNTKVNLNKVQPYGSKYRIETFGVNLNSTAAGLYPTEGIRLVDVETGKFLWEMTPGYYVTDFLWSSDNRYVTVYYESRVHGEALFVDTKDMSETHLPGISVLKAYVESSPHIDRSDQYSKPVEWLDGHTIYVDFSWTQQDGRLFKGYYTYDVDTKKIIQVEGAAEDIG